MPAPLIPILARVAMGLARSGAVRGALGAAGRSGATKQVPAVIQRLGAGRRAAQSIVPRKLLAAVGRRQRVRRAVRGLRRPRRSGAFSGRIQAALLGPGRDDSAREQIEALREKLNASRAAMHARMDSISPAVGAPGGPQGPPPPPPPPTIPPPQDPPPGPPANPTLPVVHRLGGALVKLTGIVGATGAAIAGYMLATEKLTRMLAESRRELAPYSGQIASAFSRLDVQDLHSRMRTAQGTSGSTAMLIDAVRRQHRSMEQMNRDITTVNNTIGTLQAIATEVGGHIYTGVRNSSGWGLLLDSIERNTRTEKGGETVPEKMLNTMLGPGFQPRDRAPLPPLK